MKRPLRALSAALIVAGWATLAYRLWPRQRPTQAQERARHLEMLEFLAHARTTRGLHARVALWNRLHPDRPVLLVEDEAAPLFHFKIP
jgi:hypothetical protein